MKPVHIYLVRHGMTEFNLHTKIQGWCDSPLLPSGVEGAKALGRGLAQVPFVHAYSSDLKRAVDTAQFILAENDLTVAHSIMPEFREVGFGSFEACFSGKVWQIICDYLGEPYLPDPDSWVPLRKRIAPKDRIDLIADKDPLKKAERYEQISNRLRAGFSHVVKETEKAGGGSVLVVGHAVQILTSLEILLDEPYRGEVDNCSVTLLTVENGHYKLERANDTSFQQFIKEGEAVNENH